MPAEKLNTYCAKTQAGSCKHDCFYKVLSKSGQ